MNSDKLYKVQEQDLDRLKEILTVCFQNDPLYSTLIEDEATKERLLPHLLECDVTELFETCEVFADGPELKGVLILSDESDHRHAFYNYFVSLKESLITAGWKCAKASVGWFFCSSANFASSAITFTSFVRTSFSASDIIIISVLSPT